jgi:beta-glucosidase
VKLNPGETKAVTVDIDPMYLSIFNVDKNAWQIVPGDYTIMVGGSSQNLPLKDTINLK